MKESITSSDVINWFFGLVVFSIGVANLWLVHAVPGTVFLLLSLVYFPPVADRVQENFGFVVPTVVKIILGIAIIWFTLGVSDLGDLIDGRGYGFVQPVLIV